MCQGVKAMLISLDRVRPAAKIAIGDAKGNACSRTKEQVLIAGAGQGLAKQALALRPIVFALVDQDTLQ